jgi:hypothetical protein
MNHVRNDNADATWCGELSNYEFYFKTIDQAAVNGQHGDRPVCRECVRVIVECLERHAVGE